MSAATACERSPAVYGDAGGPTRNISGTKEDRMDLPSEDCKEVLIGDTPPPAKSGPAQVEKRCEWSSLDVWLEPGTQDGSQPLSKGTQTEAALSDHEEQPSFQSGRDCDSVYMQELAESSEKVIQQGLKAFFGFLTILVNIPTLFVLELIHFLGKSVFQALVVGLITAVGEEILEPLLAAFFNSILQPLLIFLLNILCSIRNLSYPAVDLLKAVCLQVAVVLRAFRLVEITNHPKNAVAEQV